MHAHHLTHRRGEHAVGIGLAQIGLRRKGELRQIRELLQVVGVHAGRVELGAIVRYVVVRMAERPFHALQLQRLQFVATGGLDCFEIFAGFVSTVHFVSSLRPCNLFDEGKILFDLALNMQNLIRIEMTETAHYLKIFRHRQRVIDRFGEV